MDTRVPQTKLKPIKPFFRRIKACAGDGMGLSFTPLGDNDVVVVVEPLA